MAPQQLSAFIDCSTGGVGLYPNALLSRASAAGRLLLGYAALTEEEIRAGVQRLAAVLDHEEWRSATEHQEDGR